MIFMVENTSKTKNPKVAKYKQAKQSYANLNTDKDRLEFIAKWLGLR